MYQLSVQVIFDSARITSFTNQYATSAEAQAVVTTLFEALEETNGKGTYLLSGLNFDRAKQAWLILDRVAGVITDITAI